MHAIQRHVDGLSDFELVWHRITSWDTPSPGICRLSGRNLSDIAHARNPARPTLIKSCDAGVIPVGWTAAEGLEGPRVTGIVVSCDVGHA